MWRLDSSFATVITHFVTHDWSKLSLSPDITTVINMPVLLVFYSTLFVSIYCEFSLVTRLAPQCVAIFLDGRHVNNLLTYTYTGLLNHVKSESQEVTVYIDVWSFSRSLSTYTSDFNKHACYCEACLILLTISETLLYDGLLLPIRFRKCISLNSLFFVTVRF